MSITPTDWRKNNPDKRYEQKRREKVRSALRKRGILPPAGEELNEEQKIINDQISNNDFSYWENIKSQKVKTQNNISPEEYLHRKTKKEAQKLGYDFTLEVSDIVVPEKCIYLETNLISDLENEDDLNFMTLDRLDTSKGFTKSNIIIISKMAHTMRNGSTPEILINFATNVLKIHNSEEK